METEKLHCRYLHFFFSFLFFEEDWQFLLLMYKAFNWIGKTSHISVFLHPLACYKWSNLSSAEMRVQSVSFLNPCKDFFFLSRVGGLISPTCYLSLRKEKVISFIEHAWKSFHYLKFAFSAWQITFRLYLKYPFNVFRMSSEPRALPSTDAIFTLFLKYS